MVVERLLTSTLGPSSDAGAKRRLSEALSPSRRRLSAAGVFTTATAGATAAGYFALAAVAQDVLEHRSAWNIDGRWLALLASAAATRAAMGYLGARLASDGALAVERALRATLLDRLLVGAGEALPSGAQVTAVLAEVDRVGAYAERYQPARVAAALVPLLLLAAIFPLSWLVGVLLVLSAPLPPLNLSIVGMGTARVAQRHGEELRYLSGYFLDRLRGLSTLRALGAERAELARVNAASRRLSERSLAVLRVAFISTAVLEAIVTLAVAVVAIYIGLTLLGYVDVPGLPSHMSLRTGLFLLTVTPLYFQPVRALAAAYHERADALAAIDALQPLLEGPPLERDVAWPLVAPPAVEVIDLTVTFPDRGSPALDAVSLRIKRGELVGVIGSSGAGKSTLLRVLAGDLEPSTGIALLDGFAPLEVRRTDITWQGQRPYLFSGTLADNIALARPASSPDEVVDAAHRAGLGGLLARLPNGLGTQVGEGGWGLSGGEAHRVAIARTFLARAPLLLLDEPTAHLDAGSEAEIVAAILELARSATTVVATHSPALLNACDRVVSLDRGALTLEPVTGGTVLGAVA